MNNEPNTNVPVEEDHPYLFEILIQFWVEAFKFLKYIFYDIYLGE